MKPRKYTFHDKNSLTVESRIVTHVGDTPEVICLVTPNYTTLWFKFSHILNREFVFQECDKPISIDLNTDEVKRVA